MDDFESSDQPELPSQKPRPLFKMSGPWYGTRRQWLVIVALCCVLSIPYFLQQGRLCLHRAAAKHLKVPESQTWLGFQYERGIGVPQNYSESLHWYELAAGQGYALAQYNCGIMYRTGNGTAVDHKRASDWFLRSAKQGYGPALYNLGVQYRHGDGVPKDLVEAYKWMLPAAKAGYPRALQDIPLLEELLSPAELTDARHRAEEMRLPKITLPEAPN